MKILIIDQDLKNTELVENYLTMSGFECEIAENGDDGLSMAKNFDYDLVILDAVLPTRDGFSVCKELRLIKDIPIIFLSAKCEDSDIIRGLGLGADDYIKKPFSPAELTARVKAHTLRYQSLVNKNLPTKSDFLVAGALSIDKNARRVYVDGVEVSMPLKEYDLLLFLAENPNIVFSKERLLDRIWGMDAIGDSATVTVHIQRIRDKIEKNNHFIETVWGAGYRFKI